MYRSTHNMTHTHACHMIEPLVFSEGKKMYIDSEISLAVLKRLTLSGQCAGLKRLCVMWGGNGSVSSLAGYADLING